MSPGSLAALTLMFFAASLVTVVTGSTTLITVPILLQFGVEPRTAVATNMLALVLLSLGGVLPFINTPAIDEPRTPILLTLTVIGSIAGAFLLFAVPANWMRLVVPVAMIVVLIVLLAKPMEEAEQSAAPSPARTGSGYVTMGLLAVYGGFLSGGYATLITTAGIVFLRYSLIRAIAMSRLLNAASSLVAVIVFARYGIIDWRLGIALSIAAFLGGWLGSHWARKLPAVFLRRFFISAVAILAAKALIFDVPWRELI